MNRTMNKIKLVYIIKYYYVFFIVFNINVNVNSGIILGMFSEGENFL